MAESKRLREVLQKVSKIAAHSLYVSIIQLTSVTVKLLVEKFAVFSKINALQESFLYRDE